MINTLYVIGNGFDLHHELRTSYFEFANYLKEHNISLYHNLESYISYPTSNNNLWSQFESNLANLDIEEILSEHIDSLPDYGSEEFRDRDRYVFPDTMEQLCEQLPTEL